MLPGNKQAKIGTSWDKDSSKSFFSEIGSIQVNLSDKCFALLDLKIVPSKEFYSNKLRHKFKHSVLVSSQCQIFSQNRCEKSQTGASCF